MRGHAIVLMAAAALGFGAVAAGAGGVPDGRLGRLAERFEGFVVIDTDEAASVSRVAYADSRGHVHVYRFAGGKPVLEWEATGLESPVAGLFVVDVEGDGTRELIVATAAGRIRFHDARSFDLAWENRQDPLGVIRCIIVADIDDDPQCELVIASDSDLVCLDGLTKLVEWRAEGYPGVRAMVLGNVDQDEQGELVLSTGVVFDTRHRRAEFESEEPFGTRLDLIDLTGDGIPEVIGEGPESTLRVFDVFRQRELW